MSARLTGHARATAALLAAALAAAPVGGCASAVRHPAITAGVVAGTFGFATCKLASDNYPACLGVAGGAGAFLGLVTATALWLGGDGHSVLIEEQARPLPDDGRPTRRRSPAVDPDAPRPASPVPLSSAPTRLPPAAPPPASPAPASPAEAGPVETSPAPLGPAEAPPPEPVRDR